MSAPQGVSPSFLRLTGANLTIEEPSQHHLRSAPRFRETNLKRPTRRPPTRCPRRPKPCGSSSFRHLAQRRNSPELATQCVPRLGQQTENTAPYLYSAAFVSPLSFYTERLRPKRPAPPAAAHATTLPKVPTSLPPSEPPPGCHPEPTDPDVVRGAHEHGAPLKLSTPNCAGTVSDPTQRGRLTRHRQSGKGRTDRSTLAHFPYRRRILCGFDSTAGDFHPSASKRSTFQSARAARPRYITVS